MLKNSKENDGVLEAVGSFDEAEKIWKSIDSSSGDAGKNAYADCSKKGDSFFLGANWPVYGVAGLWNLAFPFSGTLRPSQFC